MSPRGCVTFTDLNPKCALPRRGAHDIGRNDLLDQFYLAQALQAGGGQDDRIVFALFKLTQAGIDVSSQGMNIEIRSNGLELRLSPQAGGAHARALGQYLKTRIVLRAEGIAGILPFRDRGNFKSRRKFGRQVFQRMHGQINASRSQCLFNFFGEHPLGADHGERDIGNLVAGSVDNFDFHFVPSRTQQRRDVVRLPEGELRTARPDAEFRHG